MGLIDGVLVDVEQERLRGKQLDGGLCGQSDGLEDCLIADIEGDGCGAVLDGEFAGSEALDERRRGGH